MFSPWGFFSCFQFEDFPLRVNIFHLEYSPVLTMRMWSHYINSISPIIQKLNNEQEQEEDNKEHTLPNGGRSTKTSAVQNTQHWNKCTNVMWRSGCRWTCEFCWYCELFTITLDTILLQNLSDTEDYKPNKWTILYILYTVVGLTVTT